MNIQKFSILTNISAHTIRYYEKMGLLKEISRNASGHRVFADKDIVWIEFIKRLKETGMPLSNILAYSVLRDKGVASAELRMEMLQDHATALESKIAEEQLHLKMLKQKIDHYKTVIHQEASLTTR